MTAVGTLLVVCTGNVCRSPYIERRLRHELDGSGISVTSAGTQAIVGSDMDAGTRELLERRGISADGFIAQQLRPELLSGADLVVTAAREHRAAAVRLYPAAMSRTVTLCDLSDLLSEVTAEELHSSRSGGSWVRQVGSAASARRGSVHARQEGVDIVDPIGGPASLFAQMAAEVDQALVPVVRALMLGTQPRSE